MEVLLRAHPGRQVVGLWWASRERLWCYLQMSISIKLYFVLKALAWQMKHLRNATVCLGTEEFQKMEVAQAFADRVLLNCSWVQRVVIQAEGRLLASWKSIQARGSHPWLPIGSPGGYGLTDSWSQHLRLWPPGSVLQPGYRDRCSSESVLWISSNCITWSMLQMQSLRPHPVQLNPRLHCNKCPKFVCASLRSPLEMEWVNSVAE